MPGSTNPFLPWLALYGPDVVPERPWWREVVTSNGDDAYVRTDGYSLRTGNMEGVDESVPLPDPRPMPGQVWIREDGLQRMIIEIDPESIYEGHDTIQYGRHRVTVAREGVEPVVGSHAWPPPYAVLVHGPGAPWAPPGWKP